MSFDLNALLRANIRSLVPYASARDEFKGEAQVFLDANENSLGSPLTRWYNRYPDPSSMEGERGPQQNKGYTAPAYFPGEWQ